MPSPQEYPISNDSLEAVSYTDEETNERHVFPVHFLRAEIDPASLEGVDMSEAVLQSIEIAAQRGIRKVFIDNLTFICRDAEKAVTAAELMIRLARLKKMYDLTMVVIAHTPKRDSGFPLTQNDLDEILQVLDLQANGKSVREIAPLLDISSSKVQRRLKKAGKLGITVESFKTSAVSAVSHPTQPTHPDTPKLF